MKNKKKMLSLIIQPSTYNVELSKRVQEITFALGSIHMPYEIILVANGGLRKMKKLLQGKHLTHVKIVGYENPHGEGYAVRYGMAQAKGTIIAFFQLGVGLYEKDIAVLVHIMQAYNADIVIGSKMQKGSVVVYPWQRKLLSLLYRHLTQALFGFSVKDTQVGLKVFHRRVLQDVFPRLLVKQYAFDLEILAVAKLLGYKKMYEAPVSLTVNNWLSLKTKSFWESAAHTVWDTFAVFYRLKILHYYDGSSGRKWKYDPELNFRINTG